MNEEWIETTLGETAVFLNGFPFKPAQLNGRGLPVVRIKQLLDPTAALDRSDIEVPTKNHLSDGDLVFTWSGTLASRFWYRGPALLNQHLFKVIPRDGLEAKWVHLTLEHAITSLATKTNGTTMKHLTKPVLEGHVVQRPPTGARARIVAVIDSTDKQIAALDAEQVRLARVLDALRNGFPSAPEMVLDEVILGIDSGESVATSGEAPEDGSGRILKLSAIRPATFKPNESKLLSVDSVMPVSSHVLDGDLLVTRSNTPDRVGYCAIARSTPARTYMPDLIWRIRLDESRCIPAYIEQLLASPVMRSVVASTASGTSLSMRKINKKGFSTIRIPLPPLETQTEYVDKCLTIATAVNSLELERIHLRRTRSAILNALLSREIEIPGSFDELLKRKVSV